MTSVSTARSGVGASERAQVDLGRRTSVRTVPAAQLGLALNFSIFSLSSVYSSQLPQTCWKLVALVGEVGPVRATTITYLNPAVAIVAGALVLGEPVTVWTIVGFVLVVTGSYLVNRGGRPEPSAETEMVSETASSCA